MATPKNTNKQGKGKAAAAQAAAAKTVVTDSNVNTTMLSLLLPTLPILSEVNKRLNATFNEVVNGPFRLFDIFSAEFIAMKNKIATNKVEERAIAFGLSDFQNELYAKLALSANKISLTKLESIVSNRNVDAVLQTSDTYQSQRFDKYQKDVEAGKRHNQKGEVIPYHEFNKKAWTGAYFQKMLFLACEYPKRDNKTK